jgi:hypothetical protein
MNLAALMLAINARAESDTGAGGLFEVGTPGNPLVSAAYYARLPSQFNAPFLVYTTAGISENDAFTKDITEPIIRITAFVPLGIASPQTRAAAILERIRGNSSAGSAPTYGFHRWVPGTVGTWYVGAFMQQDVFEEHGDDYYSYVVSFKTVCSK